MQSTCRYVKYVLLCRVCNVMLSMRKYAEYDEYLLLCRVCVFYAEYALVCKVCTGMLSMPSMQSIC